MSIKKQYLKSKDVCKVTLRVAQEQVGSAKTVNVVGDFNAWNESSMPMKRLKSGDFTITVNLGSGKPYQFRYLLDGSHWENDREADRYAPTPYGDGDNSVVDV